MGNACGAGATMTDTKGKPLLTGSFHDHGKINLPAVRVLGRGQVHLIIMPGGSR